MAQHSPLTNVCFLILADVQKYSARQLISSSSPYPTGDGEWALAIPPRCLVGPLLSKELAIVVTKKNSLSPGGGRQRYGGASGVACSAGVHAVHAGDGGGAWQHS